MMKMRETATGKTEAANLEQICSARIGSARFGIPISHILEIVGAASPQNVPLAPRFVGGLVHYRGEVLTTVSLRSLLGMPPHDGPQDLLVVENPGGYFGLLVDSVDEVLKLSPVDFEPNPSTIQENRRAFFAGAYKLKSGLLIMLDPARLEPMRLAQMGAASGEGQCAH